MSDSEKEFWGALQSLPFVHLPFKEELHLVVAQVFWGVLLWGSL